MCVRVATAAFLQNEEIKLKETEITEITDILYKYIYLCIHGITDAKHII